MHTLISSKRFEYRKVQNFAETKSQPAKELYSFKLNKSNQVYWVWIEKYPYSFYALKFHLKNLNIAVENTTDLLDYTKLSRLL